jgi:beta-galactosidase
MSSPTIQGPGRTCIGNPEPSSARLSRRSLEIRSLASKASAITTQWPVLSLILSLVVALCSSSARAQQVETSLPTSQRVTINLSAGMPGQSPWLYIKDSDSPSYATTSYNDSAWTSVGIPYSANLLTSFLNADSGGGDGDLNGTFNWYRLHFTLGTQYANSKILVEFEGAHTGAQVYINGTLLPGISAVAANANASHVIGFIPFIVDLTPYVKADGATENVIAVSVSRNDGWFEQPGFSQDYRFGQADAGLFRPAYMFITNKVHIPVNVYSNQKTWGTYVATVSEVPSASSTAQAASAVVEVQTNVLNEDTTSQQVTLTTQIVDANGDVVATAPPVTQTVAPMTSSSFPSTAAPMFDQQITVNNPTLWYPNNSTFGTPYMYKVYHIVSVNGVVVDAAQSPLGIRTITWDPNFPYFNGHPMYLWGASGRYDYPALGSSVPEEQQWRDLAQLAAEGGNIWRPGHSSTSEEFVNAADAYGIMIDQPSGDGEGAFNTPTADQVTLKEELHRDMILRDRSHPSILDWESNNGTMNETVGKALLAIDKTWDPINTRVAADRTPDPVNGYMLGCTLEGCEVGVKNQFPNNPAWGAEYWGNGTGRGLGWNYELAFAAPFLDNWRQGKAANAFGMAQWYFADSPGEDSLYVEFTGNASEQSMVRSLGASSVDMNRFPKLLYYIYEAAWTPFSIKPVVRLANHWNLSGAVQENVFSNCPSVRLLINGVQQGSTEVPNSWESNSESNLTQTTTLMPFQTSWPVTWASGTVEAECLDQYGNIVATDSRVTAASENKIVLTVIPELTRPDGTSFAVTANGSDAAFVVAQVEDVNGNVEPLASDILTFSVSGPATYMGGSEQYVSTASDAYSTAPGNSVLNYHSPGDPQLQVEGGMTKIALRSQFTTGNVTVTATAPGLATGTATYTIQPIPSVTPPATAPAIIVPPASTAVTVGRSAVFSVTAAGTAPLTFQWLKNGSAIAGATSATYTTPATASTDNNSSFTVTVTNSVGSATSSAATLIVDASAGVVITTQPASQTAYVGQTVQMSVAATGSPTLAYQWQKSGAAIAGATSSIYATPVLTSGDNGDSFTVVVSNPVNSVTSTAAVLTVAPAVAPGITQQPASLSVLANDPAIFSVAVSGSSPFTYQWQLNGVSLLGANAATFSILAVQSTNVGSYTVIVTNAAGSVTSPAATLTIAPPGVNLALDQPATSSTTQGTGLTANYVNDGNLTTRWASAGGIDPSWVEIDLGSVQAFDNVILYWEAAYANTYQIQYSNDNVNWSVAYNNTKGVGGVENLAFPTVQGRYIRMYGETRATAYGYSLYEFQVYDVAQCGGAGERYTVLSPTTVLDNLSQLTWQRAETTYASGGAQYTQPIAQTYCASQKMRLPTQAEALAISGASSASCAFPQPWSTWTSTIDPADSSDAAFVTSTGTSTWQVANNYPGAVICDAGTTVAPPTITTQPTSQTVAVGQTATFTVAANGSGTYLWSRNGTPITAATAASYTTPATVATDNGSLFSVVVANSGGSVTSNSATLTVTGASGSCTTVPSAPIGLTATASSSSAISLNWTAVTAPPNCTISSYNIYGSSTSGFTPSSSNLLSSGQTSTTYSNTGLSSSMAYFYVVEAHDAEGTSVASTQATATTQAATSGTDVVAINSGGPAISNSGGGDSSFVADEDFTGGGSGTTANTITTAGVINAAPMAVYQTERDGDFTYTIPGLTAGAQYTVLLHFAEFYFSAAGERLFNVAINGTSVLNNFDIYATAGANKALVEQFSATANSSGQIIIAYTNGTVDQAKSSGAEIRSASSSCSTPPSVPAGLSATAASSSAISLTWTAVNAPANCSISYNVYSSTTSGFVPSASNLASSGLTSTNYSSSGLTPATTYYYIVEVIDADGTSVPSSQATATTQPGSASDFVAINSGGPAEGGSGGGDASFIADEDFTGGGTDTSTNTIVVAGVTNAAPMAVYQSERAGTFTYTIPGLTAGSQHTILLHFAETYWTTAGQREFNVAINGTTVLSNFDIYAAAGANKALVEQFTATANSNGQIIISFTNGSKDQPKSSGIEVR